MGIDCRAGLLGSEIVKLTQWNHALWLGPVIALIGFLSYYTFFVQWPLFRDVPWANLLILTFAIGISITGVRRAWPEGGWRRGAGVFGVFASVSLTVMLLVFCFVLSYQLPAAELAVKQGGEIPGATLVSNDGSRVNLAEAAGDRLILVFYRGFW